MSWPQTRAPADALALPARVPSLRSARLSAGVGPHCTRVAVPSWSIGYPEQERIEVELLSPPADDSGYDWVSARAHVAVGAFRAEIPMMILASDVRRFRDALEPVYRDLRGTAEFETIEDQLRLKVEANHFGHVRVTGHVKDDASFGHRLTFTLEFDQTMLQRTLSELSHAISELQESAG